jgi:hypothetical protein
LISIRKYLDYRDPKLIGLIDPAGSLGLLDLCSAIFDHLNEFVLSGDSFDDLRTKIVVLQETLSPGLHPEQAQQIGDSVRGILAGHSSRLRETVQCANVEMQHIVEVLSQALIAMAGGSARSVSRLQKLQKTLHRTSMIQDDAALRASLADTVNMIRDEIVRENDAAAQDRAVFEEETIKAREFLAENPNRQLPGRPEGVRDIGEALKCIHPEKALYVVAFLFKQLKAISLRYGSEAASELVFRIIRERIQPIAPGNTAYRWTPQSLVGIFQGTTDFPRLKGEMAALNRPPLVHRITLGNRTAVVKVGLPHMLAIGAPGSADVLIEEVDRFTEIAGGL